MRCLSLLLLFAVATVSAETGYRYVHPDGTVEFSDAPIPGGEEIQLREAPTIKFEPVTPSPAKGSGSSQASPKDVSSQGGGITVTYPKDAQTLWFDATGMSVAVSVNPPLKEKEVINISLDDRVVASGTGSSFNIGVVFRGTHTLRATVVTVDGSVRSSSPPVTFYMRQHSQLETKAQPPEPTPTPEPIRP